MLPTEIHPRLLGFEVLSHTRAKPTSSTTLPNDAQFNLILNPLKTSQIPTKLLVFLKNTAVTYFPLCLPMQLNYIVQKIKVLLFF